MWRRGGAKGSPGRAKRAPPQGRQPVCTIESAVKTEIITDAIFRSIESGKLELVDWKG